MSLSECLNLVQLMDYLKTKIEGFDPQLHDAVVFGGCKSSRSTNKYGRFDVKVYPVYIIVYNVTKAFGGVSREALYEDKVKLQIYPNKRFLTSQVSGKYIMTDLFKPIKLFIKAGIAQYNDAKYYSYNIRNLTGEELAAFKDYKQKHVITKEPEPSECLEFVDPNAFV